MFDAGLLDIDEDTAARMEDAGYSDYMTVAVASPAELRATLGIGEQQAEQIISISREQASGGGFQTASEVKDPPDLRKVNVIENVDGWVLERQSRDRIVWLSPSDFSVTITNQSTRDGNGWTFEVSGIQPPKDDENHNPRQTKQERRILKDGIETVEEAVGFAIGWMETSSIEFEEDLTEFTGISERTAEYLLLKHDIENHQQLYELYVDRTLHDIVGSQWHGELEEEMKEIFG
ncbi:helix-hairpin-helix domain-containing protein [Natronosalvus amylolyticus]|uniref:helix-hairpin-helix domain-containing protein n=1 Tax=Natronosalvus amylolyticus TaxID=2961994 RepID=UPI0020C993D9|nr:helix-hairpin-helix domain-containing protein [Natronosalvus amylolyticus]